MPVGALEDAVHATRGLSVPTCTAHPLDPDASTRQETAKLVRALPDHPSVSAWVRPLDRWIGGGAAGGILVEWDPAELDVYAYQQGLCGHILAAKCAGDTADISAYWSPSFLLQGVRAYLLDGYHAFALTQLAHQAGFLKETPIAYAHLHTPYGATGTPPP